MLHIGVSVDTTGFDWVNTVAQVAIAIIAAISLTQIAISISEAKRQKKKDTLSLVLTEIKVFRELILEESIRITGDIQSNPPYKMIPKIELKNFRENIFDEEIKHNKSLKQRIKDQQDLTVTDKAGIDITNLLNTCEEFALSVIESGEVNHKAFEAIKKAYVETIQLYYLQLYIQINIQRNPFKYTVELYERWYLETQKNKRDQVAMQKDYERLVSKIVK